MLLHARARSAVTVLGIGVTFFLSSAQIGILMGWIRTNSAIVMHSGADLWVVARGTEAFDYSVPIPRHTIERAASIPGVRKAEGLIQTWTFWQRPDGRRVNVELVGLDRSAMGGPWKMLDGSLQLLRQPETVIVDEMARAKLGVSGPGEECAIAGERAIVRGLCQDVRTFTTSPFIFTSLESAGRYDRRLASEDISYVLAACDPAADIARVKSEMQRRIPEFEVLSSSEFASRTVNYWMLETGAGFTLVITAALSLCVGAVITSQALFAITQEHLPQYATLLALGFRRASLLSIAGLQSLFLGLPGVGLGTALYLPAAAASMRSPVPMELNLPVFGVLVMLTLACCSLASLMSLRSIFGVDPVSVFRS